MGGADDLTSPSTTDPSYNSMIAKALRLLRGRAARERALAEVVKNHRAQRDEFLLAKSLNYAGDDTPQEVIDALREPAGVDQLIAVYRDGMLIKAVLHPRGRPDPEREAVVWHCLLDQALAERGGDRN